MNIEVFAEIVCYPLMAVSHIHMAILKNTCSYIHMQKTKVMCTFMQMEQ